MIIVLKNFFRNNYCNLTIASIRHFIPDADIWVLCLYKQDQNEYDSQETLNISKEKIIFKPTKYVGMGPGNGNPNNGLFFSEGYNIIYDHFKDKNDLLLMLTEDHFFTSGKTLNEIKENTFDLAYGTFWDGINGSIFCFNIQAVKHIFPIPEIPNYVETHFQDHIVAKISSTYHLTTRRPMTDYGGDGIYTNDYNEMKKELVKAGIIK